MSCANHRIKAGKTQSECKQRVLHTRQDRRQPLDCHILSTIRTRDSIPRLRAPLLKRPISGSAGKNWNPPSTTRIFATNCRSRKRKTGVLSEDLGLSPHFRILKTEVCGKFQNLLTHCSFHAKIPQIKALTYPCMDGKSIICRILSDSLSLRSRYELGIVSIRPLNLSIRVSL